MWNGRTCFSLHPGPGPGVGIFGNLARSRLAQPNWLAFEFAHGRKIRASHASETFLGKVRLTEFWRCLSWAEISWSLILRTVLMDIFVAFKKILYMILIFSCAQLQELKWIVSKNRRNQIVFKTINLRKSYLRQINLTRINFKTIF